MSDFISVYVTFPNLEEARATGKIIVEERLAACVNIIHSVSSIYIWDGKLNEDEEVVFFAKTTRNNFEKLSQRIIELHSYSCPCIVSLPIELANPAYLAWIKQSCEA